MFEIRDPWPWYIAGPLIGLVVPALLIMGNKPFGISSTLRHICAACIPAKISFFQYDWKEYTWNLFFVGGISIGGFIAATFLSNPADMIIDHQLASDLASQAIYSKTLMPLEIFSWKGLTTVRGFILIVIGGFLVGFGTRWGNGCTSGHAITGLSNLQWPSLVATISFFAGGLVTSWFILPIILSLF